MTPLAFILWLVIAAVCGGIGRAIAGGTHGGCLVSIALGFIGAFFGSWLARQLHLPEPLLIDVGHHRFPIVWSIVGSALLVAVVHLISGNRRRNR